MLSAGAVVPYLLQCGLLEDRDVADSELQVLEVSRRNHNFKVFGNGGPGYFLKQGRGADAVRSVAYEAQLYQWFRSHPSADALGALLPRCRFYDPEQCTLVLELLEQSQSLYQFHWRHRRVTAAIGTALGEALATLHRLTGSTTTNGDGDPGPGPAAGYLLLHHPGIDALTRASAAALEVVAVVQQSPELSEALDRLNREWRPTCVVHGDLRWDNCQVVPESLDAAPRVQFVDWEMAGIGDPRWDVGTVFSECLSEWLLSAPATSETPPGDFLPLARSPLRAMQPAMRSFWRAYVRGMKLDRATAADWLARSARYAGARLVQHAYEAMQGSFRLNANTIYLLQLSLNIIDRPLEAVALLLGIPAERTAAA